MSRSVLRLVGFLVLSFIVDIGATRSDKELGRWRNSSCQEVQCATSLTSGRGQGDGASGHVVRPSSVTDSVRGKRQNPYFSYPFLFTQQQYLPVFPTAPAQHVDIISRNPTHSDRLLTGNSNYYNSESPKFFSSRNCNGQFIPIFPNPDTGYPYELKLSTLDQIPVSATPPPNVIQPPSLPRSTIHHHTQLSSSEFQHQNQHSNREYNYSSKSSSQTLINFDQEHKSTAPPHLVAQPPSPPKLYKSRQTNISNSITTNNKGYTYRPKPPISPVDITGPQLPAPTPGGPMLSSPPTGQHNTVLNNENYYYVSKLPSFPTDINVPQPPAPPTGRRNPPSSPPNHYGTNTVSSYPYQTDDQKFELKHSHNGKQPSMLIVDNTFGGLQSPYRPAERNAVPFPNNVNFHYTETKLSHVDTKGYYYGPQRPSPPVDITGGPQPPAPPLGGPQPPSPPPGYNAVDSFPLRSNYQYEETRTSDNHKEGYHYGPRGPSPPVDIIGGPQPPAPPLGGPQPPSPPPGYNAVDSFPLRSSTNYQYEGTQFSHNHKEGYHYGPRRPSPPIDIIGGFQPSAPPPGGPQPPSPPPGYNAVDSFPLRSSTDYQYEETRSSDNHKEGYHYGPRGPSPPIDIIGGPQPPAPPLGGPQPPSPPPGYNAVDSFPLRSSTDYRNKGTQFSDNHKEGYHYGPRGPAPPIDIIGGPQPPAPLLGGPQPPSPPPGYNAVDSFPLRSSTDYRNKGTQFSDNHKEGYHYGPRGPAPPIDIIGGPQPPAPPLGGPQPPPTPPGYNAVDSFPLRSSTYYQNEETGFSDNHKEGYHYGPRRPSPPIDIIGGPQPPAPPPGGPQPPSPAPGYNAVDSFPLRSSTNYQNEETRFSDNHKEGYHYGPRKPSSPVDIIGGLQPPAPPPGGPHPPSPQLEHYTVNSFPLHSVTDFHDKGTFSYNNMEGYHYGSHVQPPAPTPGGPQPPSPPPVFPTNSDFHNQFPTFSDNHYGSHPSFPPTGSQPTASPQEELKSSSLPAQQPFSSPRRNYNDYLNSGSRSSYNQNFDSVAISPTPSAKHEDLSISLEPPYPPLSVKEFRPSQQSTRNFSSDPPSQIQLEHGYYYPHSTNSIYDNRNHYIPSQIENGQHTSAFHLSIVPPPPQTMEQYSSSSFDVYDENHASSPAYSSNHDVSIVPSLSFSIADSIQERTEDSAILLSRNLSSAITKKTFRSNEECISNVEVTGISCSKSNPERYFRARIRPLNSEYNAPVVENVKTCTLIREEGTSWYRLDYSDSELENCGVRECRNSQENAQGLLCVTIRIPRIQGLKTPEDILFTIECQPQKSVTAQTKSFKFKTPQNVQPRATISGGTDASFASKMALYVRPHGSAYFSHVVTANDTVRLGDEIQLRCDIKDGDGWQYSRIKDVTLHKDTAGIHAGDSIVLVGPDGCRNPHMKAVCPWHPIQHSDRPLTSSFTWKAFGFQASGNGNEEMVVTARVLACVHPSHCLLDTSLCEGEIPITRSRRHYIDDISANNETTLWRSDLTFKVKLSS